MNVSGTSNMIGVVVGGDFTIMRPLAEGGMGAVFVVAQKSTGKERALKLMHREIASDADFKRRFEREAQVGARIKSEHVVEVLASGVDEGTALPYLVMELLEGEDLRQRLARAALSIDETRMVLEQLCHAISAAHAAGVIHRDLKPENVFLARSRRAGAGAITVKVLDFGIAKLVLESTTRATRGAVGSPLWMAPEQTTPGPVTAAADVWSIALLTYEMLVGKSYWRTANREDGNTLQLLREIVLETLPPATERAAEYGRADRLPLGFDAWFAQCLVREPANRLSDATMLCRVLPPALASSVSHGAEGDSVPTPMTSAPKAVGSVGSGSVEELGATQVAPEGLTPIAASRMPALDSTGAATPFNAGAIVGDDRPTIGSPVLATSPAATSFSSPPRPVVSRVPQETPIVTVHDAHPTGVLASHPPPAKAQRALVGILVAIAVCAVGVAAWSLARHPTTATTAIAVTTTPPAAAAASTAIVAAEDSATPVVVPAVSASSAPRATTTTIVMATPAPSATTPPTPSASASAKPHVTSAAPVGGFTDPTDRNGPVTWKVQDRHVRLFTRLASNESNVTDTVVRKAMDHSSWEYLRCYERIFASAKDLPEGIVSVSFEIIDQLPRHAALASSTFTNATFNDCVVRTVVGQTINAAGPDGKGRATLALRFVPN